MQEFVRQPQKRAAEREKIQHRAEKHTQQHEQPQFSTPDIERQKEQADQKIKRKQQIEPDSQRAAPAADEAKQVVKDTECHTEQGGEYELPHLQRNRQLHQPNRRRKKPPSRIGV